METEKWKVAMLLVKRVKTQTLTGCVDERLLVGMGSGCKGDAFAAGVMSVGEGRVEGCWKVVNEVNTPSAIQRLTRFYQ